MYKITKQKAMMIFTIMESMRRPDYYGESNYAIDSPKGFVSIPYPGRSWDDNGLLEVKFTVHPDALNNIWIFGCAKTKITFIKTDVLGYEDYDPEYPVVVETRCDTENREACEAFLRKYCDLLGVDVIECL